MITFACHYLKSQSLSGLRLCCVWSVLPGRSESHCDSVAPVASTCVTDLGSMCCSRSSSPPLKWRFMLSIPRKLIMTNRASKIMLITLIFLGSCYCRHSGLFAKHLLAICSRLIHEVFINQRSVWRSFWPSGFLWLILSSTLGFSKEVRRSLFCIVFNSVWLTFFWGYINKMEIDFNTLLI